MFEIIVNCSEYLRCIPPKNKNSHTITKAFSNILSSSKQKPVNLESDRGREWYISLFHNFLTVKIIHHHSRFFDKGPSIVERVIRTVRSLLKNQYSKKEELII